MQEYLFFFILLSLGLVGAFSAENITLGGNNVHLRRLEGVKAPLAHYPPAFEDVDVDGSNPAKVTVETIPWDDAIKRTQDVLNLIHARYELGSGVGKSFFLTSQNMATRTFDMIMYKFCKLLVDSHRREYLMVFGGSSVTAGHDNYYEESYPLIVRQRLLPIFDMLGIAFRARNIAMGSNDCMPYTYCYESMGGQDPDWLGWEQSYNCGNDAKVFELLGRIAGFSKNRAVVYYSASGAFKPDKCAKSESQPAYSSKDWTPEKAGVSLWNPGPSEVEQWRKNMNNYHKVGASARRFDSFTSGTTNYKGLGTYGFNVWMGNPKCSMYGVAGNVTKTGCSGAEVGMTCAESTDKLGLKFMTREAGEYSAGHGANWHPTRGFHLLRGEFITFVHALALMGALHHVREELKNGAKPEVLADSFEGKLEEMHAPIQAPRFCSPYKCKNKPTCYISYYPHYQHEYSLQSAVVGKTGWSYTGQLMDDEFHTKWGYRDSRPSFEITSDMTKKVAETDVYPDLHLRLSVTDPPMATLCGLLTDAVFYIHVNGLRELQAQASGNFEYVPPTDMQQHTKVSPTLKEMQNTGCIHLDDLPVGEHVLTIRANLAQDKKVHVRLTHLVVWDEKGAHGDQSAALRAEAEKAATSSGASLLFPSQRDAEDI